MVQFFWKEIICRFGVPHTQISNNGTQLENNPFREWCGELGINQRFTSVAHLEENGKTEVTNRKIVYSLETRLNEAKGRWVDELQSVL